MLSHDLHVVFHASVTRNYFENVIKIPGEKGQVRVHAYSHSSKGSDEVLVVIKLSNFQDSKNPLSQFRY